MKEKRKRDKTLTIRLTELEKMMIEKQDMALNALGITRDI